MYPKTDLITPAMLDDLQKHVPCNIIFQITDSLHPSSVHDAVAINNAKAQHDKFSNKSI
jgi:hypothetical protein